MYVFDDSDFTSATVWSVKTSEGWTMDSAKGGTVNYSSSSLQCTFTTHPAILPPTGETADEAATALVMASEEPAQRPCLAERPELANVGPSSALAKPRHPACLFLPIGKCRDRQKDPGIHGSLP